MPTLQADPKSTCRSVPSIEQPMVIHAMGHWLSKSHVIGSCQQEDDGCGHQLLYKMDQFIWKNIICHFGYPQSLVTDNGLQFIGKQITEFFLANIERHRGKMGSELPEVLCSYCTTKRKKRSIGKIPFSLAYEAKAIILPYITITSWASRWAAMIRMLRSRRPTLICSMKNGNRPSFELRLISTNWCPTTTKESSLVPSKWLSPLHFTLKKVQFFIQWSVQEK